MTKIIVKNKDWNGARAKLQSSLDAQKSAFNASLKAALAPPAATTKPDAPVATPQAAPRSATGAKLTYNNLPRSRLSG